MILLVLVSGGFAQNVIQNGLGFWVNTLFDDALNSGGLREKVRFPVEWRSLQLLQARDSRLDLFLEIVSSRVNWVVGDIEIVKFFLGLAKVLN